MYVGTGLGTTKGGRTQEETMAGDPQQQQNEESCSDQQKSSSSHEHGKPYEGMCCLCSMEDITEGDGNYVEYQSYPSMVWKPSLFEKSIVQQVRNVAILLTMTELTFFSSVVLG